MGAGQGRPSATALKLPVVLRPQARAELVDDWSWYEEQRPGLGDELVTCVEAAFSQPARAPLAHPVVDEPVRRVLVRRFPYAVFFVPGPDGLLVLAVAHVRRKPGYWNDRLSPASEDETEEGP